MEKVWRWLISFFASWVAGERCEECGEILEVSRWFTEKAAEKQASHMGGVNYSHPRMVVGFCFRQNSIFHIRLSRVFARGWFSAEECPHCGLRVRAAWHGFGRNGREAAEKAASKMDPRGVCYQCSALSTRGVFFKK